MDSINFPSLLKFGIHGFPRHELTSLDITRLCESRNHFTTRLPQAISILMGEIEAAAYMGNSQNDPCM